jgi:hypothetical protein
MLDPASLERRFLSEVDHATAPASRRSEPSQFQIVITAMVGIAALAVVIASVRLTDSTIQRSVDEQQAAQRFLAQELSVLRLMAMTSRSVVPARLYLGIEECFQSRAPVPFDESRADEGREVLAGCADAEVGRLQAQAGTAMADEGRRVLRESLSGFVAR